MRTGQQERSSTEERVPSPPGLGALFCCVAPEVGCRVAEEALRHRSGAPQGARDALNAAIDNSAIAIDGFKKSSIAPVPKLATQLEAAVRMNHRLAGALLEVWKESRPELADAVSAYLQREGIPLQSGKRERFSELQPAGSLRADADRIRDEFHDRELDPDDALVMLAYLSGRFPHSAQLRSGRFADWLKELDDLPPEAAEWDEAPAFADSLREMAAAKREERADAERETLSGALAAILANFADDLRYLELETSAWSAPFQPASLDSALGILEELDAVLREFQGARPQAPTLGEERQRARERDRLAAEIARLIEAWREIANSAPDSGSTAGAEDETPPRNDDSGEPGRLESENAALRAERDRLAADKKHAEDERVRVVRDLAERRLSYDKLRTEKDEQGEENSHLKRENREIREQLETLRIGLRPRIKGENRDIEIANVPDAIHVARQLYEPDRLLIALNAASREDTPYRRPDKVFDALEWLATEYYDLRANPLGANPEYDRRLKEACNGWSFSIKQSDTAKNMFTAEYETTVEGTTYTLDHHIGDGSKGDPQIMIRIGFAWDERLRKVIVGYIGRHQRTKAS